MSENHKKLNDWMKIKSLPNPLREAFKELSELEYDLAVQLEDWLKRNPEKKKEFEQRFEKIRKMDQIRDLIVKGSFLLDLYRDEHGSLLWQLNEAKRRLGIPKNEKITEQKNTKK